MSNLMKDKILQMLYAKDVGKAAYAEADRLLDEILMTMKVGEQVQLGEGQVAELVDNFAVKNKSWKPCGISRFDIKTRNGSFVPPAQSPNTPTVSPSEAQALASAQPRTNAAPPGAPNMKAQPGAINPKLIEAQKAILKKTRKSPKPSALTLRIREHEQDAKRKR